MTEFDKLVSAEKRTLVAFFSHSGKTRILANQICEYVGGEIFEIEPAEPYPTDYNAAVAQAQQELNSNNRPALKTGIENIALYDVIVIGYPNWWGTFPRPVATFLAEYDFSGKTIAPFCTHDGSGVGQSVTEISKLCPRSTVTECLAIWGSHVDNAQSRLTAWLESMRQ